MKKYSYLLSFALLFLFSCQLDDDNTPSFHFEVMPITSVEVPEQFVHGNTYEISVSYNRPSTCHQFNDFIYSVEGAERSVAVVNTVYSIGCANDPEEVSVGFDFAVLSFETHIFKFYQGVDETGLDQYLIVEVPVVTEGD